MRTTSSHARAVSDRPIARTSPSTNRTSWAGTPRPPAATCSSRARICSQAFLTAPPLRSAPEDAAVAEVFGTLSVRVGARRTFDERYAERGGRDLEHLGVQPLAHLGAAVVDQHRAVLVDVHQRSRLVEGGQVERDPELDGRDRQRALDVLVRGVEPRDLVPATRRCRADSMHLRPDRIEPLGVPHRLAVRRRLAIDVEVAAAQLHRVEPEQGRTPAEDVLDHDHPLRSAEPPERGLRGLVGLRDPAGDPDVGDPVGVVDVAQGAGQHRFGEVEAPATVGRQRGLERLDQARRRRSPPATRRGSRGACRSS